MSLLFIVCKGAPDTAFGDLYLALGSLSVKEKIFLLRRIVFSIISFAIAPSSPEFGIVEPD
jgi:hypothetical protein